MPTIDNLSINIEANNQAAISNVEKLANAVETLSKGLKGLETQQFREFAEGLRLLKGSAPNDAQTAKMTAFAGAISALSAAIGGATNLTGVAADVSELSKAVKSMSGGKATTVEGTAQAISQIGAKAKETSQNLKEMSQNVSNKNNTPNYDKMANDFAKVNQEIDKTATNFSKFGMRLKNLGIITTTKKFDSLQRQIDKTRDKYNQLREAMEKSIAAGTLDTSGKEYERKAAQLDGLIQKYNDLMLQQRQLALEGGGVQLNPQISKALSSFYSGFSKVTNIVKSGFIAAIRSASNHIKKFASHLFQADKAAGLLKKADLASVAKKVGNELLRVSKMLKLMVTRMALRAVIKEIGNGFKSLALHSDEFNNAMSNIINASKRLGYSFSSMLSPLINALAPAIVYVINLLTKLLNIINQVFSALTGATTWNKAKNFTDSWRDSITGAGSAASKTAKELKKTVLGFDELNQLQDNKNSGGGGGSDITDMFETVKIDDKWKKFAEWLKDMWKNKDFYKLGELIGKNLKAWLDSIPWDRIRQTSNDLGKSLATLINGLVEVDGLAVSIGRTVAQGVNTVFEFINGFVHNIHWDSIGKFIAETFNGFFENIDWNLIRDTIVAGFKGLALSIQTFINTFHWDNISNAISNVVNILVEGIYKFVKGIDWGQLGTLLGDQLMKTIKKIKWKELGRAIGSILQSAISFVASFVHEIDVDDVVKAVGNLIDGILEEVDPKQLGETIAEIINKAIDIAKGIWNQNKGKIKDALKKLWDGFWNTIDKEDLGKIVATILGAAVLVGLASMVATILKSVIVTGFANLLISALFGGGAAAGGSALGGTALATATASGLAIGGAVIGGIATGLALSEPVKDAIFNLGIVLGANEDQVKNVKEAYDGLDGTWRLVKEGAQELWYTITNNEEALKNLDSTMNTIRDSTGEVDKVVDRFGNTIIDVEHKIADITKSSEGQIQVYDNARAAVADYTDAIKVGADRMIDIKVGTDEAGKTISTVSETIFPKLAENTYKAATAEESIAKATDDYRKKLEEVKEHQTVYKTTLDVIREAQKKNVKIVEESAVPYQQYVDQLGRAKIVIQDSKPAYDKAGDAAKEASDKVASYMSSTSDVIKITSDLTDQMEGTIKVYDTARDSADKLSEHVINIKGATGDVIEVIPNYNKQLESARTEMDKTSDVAKETGDNIVKGVKEPLEKATFGDVAKSFFDSLYHDLCDIFGIKSPAKNMNPVGDNIMLGIVEGFNESIKNFTEAITKFFDDTVKPWFDADQWTFDGIKDGLKASFDVAVKAVKETWNNLAKWLNEKLKFKVDDIDIAGKHIMDGFEINLGKIPTYSTGGMPEDGLFFSNHSELVGKFSNGKTAVANNNQIIAGIEQGVYNATVRANANSGGSDKYIVTEISVDKQKLARVVSQGQEKNNRRYSPVTI